MNSIDELFDELIKNDDENKSVYEVAESVSSIISSIVVKRNEMNLSQKKLAESCKMKQSALARIECLQVMPRIDTVIKILNNLGLELITDDIESNNKDYYNLTLKVPKKIYNSVLNESNEKGIDATDYIINSIKNELDGKKEIIYISTSSMLIDIMNSLQQIKADYNASEMENREERDVYVEV